MVFYIMRAPLNGVLYNARTIKWCLNAVDAGQVREIPAPRSGSPGPQYKLCWGHSPVFLAEYRVEIDPIGQLSGPEYLRGPPQPTRRFGILDGGESV